MVFLGMPNHFLSMLEAAEPSIHVGLKPLMAVEGNPCTMDIWAWLSPNLPAGLELDPNYELTPERFFGKSYVKPSLVETL